MENQTTIPIPANGASIVKADPAPTVDQFVDLVGKGGECWILAGELLVKLKGENPNVFREIADAHPFLTVDALEIFYHIGTRSLHPLSLLLPRDIFAKVRTMRFEAQQAVLSAPVEVVSRMSGDMPVIIRKPVSKLTNEEARRALYSRGNIPVKEQIKAIRLEVKAPAIVNTNPTPHMTAKRRLISKGKFAISKNPAGSFMFQKTAATPYDLQRVMITGAETVIELCIYEGDHIQFGPSKYD